MELKEYIYTEATKEGYKGEWFDDYSTMVPGKIGCCISKDDKHICWGLSEFRKPPTLISPRPRINLIMMFQGKRVMFSEVVDDAMNICIKREKPEDIYKAMFDDSIVFQYDLTLED